MLLTYRPLHRQKSEQSTIVKHGEESCFGCATSHDLISGGVAQIIKLSPLSTKTNESK